MLDPEYDEAEKEAKDSLMAIFTLGIYPLAKKISSLFNREDELPSDQLDNDPHL